MSSDNLELIETWLRDLNQVVADQDLGDDDDIRRRINLMEIELEGLRVSLPDTDQETRRLLFARHRAAISAQVFDVLVSALGYYGMQARRAGDNEPPLGSELGQTLRRQLEAEESDVFAIQLSLAAHLARITQAESST